MTLISRIPLETRNPFIFPGFPLHLRVLSPPGDLIPVQIATRYYPEAHQSAQAACKWPILAGNDPNQPYSPRNPKPFHISRFCGHSRALPPPNYLIPVRIRAWYSPENHVSTHSPIKRHILTGIDRNAPGDLISARIATRYLPETHHSTQIPCRLEITM